MNRSSYLLVASIAALGGAVHLALWSQGNRPLELTTPYHAVQLSNGQVYIGRLSRIATSSPVLEDIYYPQASARLVQRAGEAHGPDRMVLNEEDIVMFEPVAPNSVVARAITRLKNE